MNPRRIILSITEYFLLSESRAAAERTADRRRLVRDALRLARQKGEAADVLWANGHRAEGLRLVIESLQPALQAAQNAAVCADARDGAGSSTSRWRAVLLARGVPERKLALVARAEN